MSSIPPDQFRRLFKYEQDAHRRVLDSLRRAESDHHDDADVAKAVDLAAHSVFRNSLHDILVQLFGHSLYHRGQIALLIRRSGSVPAATDFVFWSRRSPSE
jgi:uncharacterized damage-inducible protein DinB